MIWSSRLRKVTLITATGVSVGAHALGAYMFWEAPEIQAEGGAEGAVQARLGNSFADLTAGTRAPDTPDTVQEADPTEVAEPVTPGFVPDTEPDSVIEQTETQDATETAQPTPQPTPQPKESDAPLEQAIAPELPVEATPPTTALVLAPAIPDADRAELAAPAPVEPLDPPEPIEPLQPTAQAIEAAQVPPTVTATASPPETLQALPEDGVQVSPRPQVRPERIEQEAEQRRADQRQERQQQPTRRVQQGNAEQNNVAGSETGSNQAAEAQQSANTGRSAAAGNAAASNYPGRVMRCISRAGRPRVSARGTAVVGFAIAANGRVTQVGLAKSSGDARLDRAAVQTISRVGSCPAPPPGARTRFSIQVKGQG